MWEVSETVAIYTFWYFGNEFIAQIHCKGGFTSGKKMFRLHENEILVPERCAEKLILFLPSTKLSEIFEDLDIQTFAPQCSIQVFPICLWKCKRTSRNVASHICMSARKHPATKHDVCVEVQENLYDLVAVAVNVDIPPHPPPTPNISTRAWPLTGVDTKNKILPAKNIDFSSRGLNHQIRRHAEDFHHQMKKYRQQFGNCNLLLRNSQTCNPRHIPVANWDMQFEHLSGLLIPHSLVSSGICGKPISKEHKFEHMTAIHPAVDTSTIYFSYSNRPRQFFAVPSGKWIATDL